MRHNQGIWDAHVHTHGGCTVDGYLRNGRDNLSASGLDGMNLLCVRHGKSACITDAEALLLKALMPGQFTVYCNPAFQIEEFGSDAEGLHKQILGFAEAGADGVKLGDGEAGENVNQQIENLLSRHPDARITFAHFFFKADDLDSMAAFLDHYPNTRIDITPCSDLYYHLSQNPNRSREFFETYSDRLIFGTDNEMELDPVLQIALVRQFLETDESFFCVKYGFDITGIAPLQKETLEKISVKWFPVR